MTPEELIEFGQRARKIRKYLRISQKEFAVHLNISNTYLSEIESGKFRPGFEFFVNMVTKFDVNIRYLVTGEGDFFIKTENDSKKYYGENSELIEEMLRDFEHVSMVKFAVLEFYQSYKISKKELIKAAREEFREEKLHRKKKE
ncbi:MAG: helix-turn-helix transcriptional regulator [Candidatus Aminicenantes bacterium]|nr:MAG: helix-turn-helix transcriptional regulator [Candidatus Aminicenantes bacterium]